MFTVRLCMRAEVVPAYVPLIRAGTRRSSAHRAEVGMKIGEKPRPKMGLWHC
jgi:hypothetical protein